MERSDSENRAPPLGMSVDGVAVATSSRPITELEMGREISELRRKLERRDAEYKRKDREVAGLQKEILTLTKDMQEIRERNEQLQQSLTNARLLTATAREDSDTRVTNARILELESLYSRSENRLTETMGELEVMRAEKNAAESQIKTLSSTIETKKGEISSLQEELYSTNLKLKTLQIRYNEKDAEFEALRHEYDKLKEMSRSIKGAEEYQKMQVNNLERTIAELTSENKKLKASMLIRSETNAVLRSHMNDMNNNNLVITKDEMNHVKQMEIENKILHTRTDELIKSVELHMELLQRSEAEIAGLKVKLEDAEQALNDMKEEKASQVQAMSVSANTFSAMKKEVVALRKQNKELLEQIDIVSRQKVLAREAAGGQHRRTEPPDVHDGPATNSEERRRRKLAEEAAKALKNRISHLLEQLDQASKLAVAWQEEKTYFQAEISALHKVNYELRERLLNTQRSYMEKTLQDVLQPNDRKFGKAAFLTETASPTEHQTHKMLTNGTFNDGQGVPTSSEGFVERQLFDIVCGFISGLRVKDSQQQSKITHKGPEYVVAMNVDGVFDIRPEDAQSIAQDIEAEELLSGLQIHGFLKFVQSRQPEKMPLMFTEKIANILNFFRRTMQDYLQQLGDNRMACAKLQSKISTSADRVVYMKNVLHREKLAKQKISMKYVREQMRLSDLKLVIHDISRRTRQTIDELEERKNTLNEVLTDDRKTRELITQIVAVTEELTTTASSAVTEKGEDRPIDAQVGALELRLPSSQVDDETMHGIVGLICGALGHNPEAISNGEGDDFAGTRSSAADGFSKEEVMMANSLGITITGEKIAAASLLAKSFLSVQSNYVDRILLLNLKDNMLSDLSCKVLSALVEKSKSLRMLDLRGNFISATGAKLLFDATRRNSTVLYVTQKQNGFMIEGHREIAGSSKNQTDQNVDDGIDDDDALAPRLRDLLGEKKYPLRVDLRNNDPERTAIEKMLQSTEYKPVVASGAEEANETPQRRPQASLQVQDEDEPIKLSTWTSHGQKTVMENSAPRLRPKSAANTVTTSSMLQTGIKQSRPISATLPRAAINTTVKVPLINDDSVSDAGSDADLHPDIQKRITTQKESHDLGGGGVGSLLDHQIRKFQENKPVVEDKLNSANKKPKKMTRRKSLPGAKKQPLAKSNGKSYLERQKEVRGVYSTPIVPMDGGMLPGKARPASANAVSMRKTAPPILQEKTRPKSGTHRKSHKMLPSRSAPLVVSAAKVASATKEDPREKEVSRVHNKFNPAMLF